MTFLHPWAFGFAALAPVIVLLYLLKVRRRVLAVSTLLFWERVLRENRRRALFQRLRRWWSLLLHLAIFTLVLLALARPTRERLAGEGSSLVLVLDTRARMQATEPGGATRMERALRRARALAEQAGPAREIAILSAGPEPAVVVPFTGDPEALRSGLEKVRAGEGGGALDLALRLARELLAARAGEARLLVLTDRADAPGSESVATPLDNVAITQFAARATPGDAGGSEVLLQVANYGRHAVHGNVELTRNGRPLEVRPFSLGPGEESAQVRPLPAGGGELAARLDTHDALPLDDVAVTKLEVRPPVRVLLVSRGNWFLEKLLGADARVQYELLTPESFAPALQAGFAVTIFDDFVPPGATSGNALYLGRTPFGTGEAPLEEPVVTEAESGSPLLRAVHLEQVVLARATPMRAPAGEGWKLSAPLRFGEQPLLLAGTHGEQRVAALGFGVADSDLPLRVAFPLLISNLVHWLAHEPEPAAPGLSRPAAESDLRGAGGETETLPSRRAPEMRQPLWQMLVLAALALLALEWGLFHRRRTE